MTTPFKTELTQNRNVSGEQKYCITSPVPDKGLIHESFRKYAALVGSELNLPAFFTPQESEFALQVERGLAFAAQMVKAQQTDMDYVGRLMEVASRPGLREMRVIERFGIQRPVYRPLLIYAWLTAFELRYETL